MVLSCWTAWAYAEGDYAFRYVSTNGAFTNGGTSWADAKNNLQNAIDELFEEIRVSGKTGYVFVAGEDAEEGMVFTPSKRSTSESDGSVFNTSFCIYEGIHVFGGFKGDEVPTVDFPNEQDLPKLRIMTNGETYAHVESDIDADKIGQTVRRWNFKYKTVLSGSHSTTPFSFRFDQNRGVYSTVFPMNSYHVVWFGTNGKVTPDEEGAEKGLTGHYLPLDIPAVLDGCTIEGGYASSTNLKGHDHTGYGGGVYMVRNAMLRNCIVRYCSAMQRGGAVYMDGGGEVERCYIHTSQATGYGMQEGYGGGVCIDYDGAVKHSYIIQCAARIGAGLAICHVPHEYPEQTAKSQSEAFRQAYITEDDGMATPYDPFALSTVIANCTSNAEGAGVYLDEGGTLNHCSVVNNKCIGPDIIYYGRRHGRTGGIYVRNGGTIYNSVAWGNECAVNNDVQFAAFKEGEKHISVYHSAFSKGDITDWAAVIKESAYTLEDANYPSPEHNKGNFPMFSQPTLAAGIQFTDNGVVHPDQNAPGEPYQRVYNWHPLALSDLRGKAVQVTDAVQGLTDEILHAHTDVDVVGRSFESVSSCGALAHSYRNIQYALLPSMEKVEGRDPSETTNIPTLFVDPNLVTAGGENTAEHTGFKDDQPMGNSWTHPMQNLADAIYYFKQRLKDTNFTQADYAAHPERTYYCLCEGDSHDPSKHFHHVQILVKEGNLNVAGQGSYISGHARTASLRPGSNMRLYGAFPKENTGTDVEGRDPYEVNSNVSANILNGTFENNSVHVIAIANQHDVIVDGFRLFSGNANVAPAPGGDPESASDEWKLYFSLADGAGVVVNNAQTANPTKRRDMTGNILRNIVMANCAAPEGAAVYVSGGFLRGNEDGSAVSDQLCRAELTMVNVIVRNCTAGDIYEDPDRFVAKPDDTPATMQITLAGVCTANGNGKILVRNCDIVNNTGFPFKCDSVKLNDDYISGKIEVYNSLTFSNGLRVHQDRSNITNTVFCPKESWYKVTGKYIFMGYDVLLPENIVSKLEENHIYRVLTHNKNEDKATLHTRVDDGTQQGYWGTDASTEVVVHYPTFVNPSRNVGHSTGDDQSYYGGRINYEPLPTNPIVNAGCTTIDTGTGASGTMACMSYDMGLRTRDYGGDPDVGAIETLRLPKAGMVLYVTPDGAGKRDGSSWANAIQGNAIYALNGVAAGSDAIDAQNGARLINTTGDGSATTGAADGVLTTDNRYCGGFARSWFKERRTGAATTTTITDTWTIEKNVYDDGVRAGEEEIIRNDTEPTQTTNIVINDQGTAEGGFSSGWADDERFPYGEQSGQSRAFWRATGNFTPVPEWWTANSFKSSDTRTDSYTGETVTGIGSGTFNEMLTDPDRGIKIRNNRTEDYVSGLQYAVERAAAYNALANNDPGRIEGIDSVQVWVSNGIYTDYKGFIMRDNTTVMGGFPAKDGGTPGLNEREALMSAIIDIPKSMSARDLESVDYETILQVSDVNPKEDNEHLNMDAVKFWDDDYAKLTGTQTTKYAYKTRTITHHFTHYDAEQSIDMTSTYVQYSDMMNGSANVFASNTTNTVVGDRRYYTFGTATEDKDCWHVSAPNNNVGKIIGAFERETAGTIYENGVKVSSGKNKRGSFRDGCLTGVEVWQTLKNVPAGGYMIKIDLAAFYYDNYNNMNGNAGNPNVNVTLQILDASDNILNSRPISYYSGREDMNRYSLSFTQAATGNVTVKLVVGPGLDRDGNEVPDDFSLAMNKNPNRREINMDNLKLYQLVMGDSYSENIGEKTDVTVDRVVDNPLPDEVTSGTAYTVTKHRSTLRKRVLQMPDKANPVYGGGGYMGDPTRQAGAKFTTNADYISHSERVIDSRRKANNQYTKFADPDYDWYTDATWDGFTIRHGFLHDFAMSHGGGAGVSMYEGGHLKNCIIINTIVSGERNKGGGAFVDGATASVEGCFIIDNTCTRSNVTDLSPAPVISQIFAGGMFMYEGTCYNTLIANNYSLGNGGGLGLCVGKFYNNTLAYNICGESTGGGGLRIAKGAESYILMANSIIYGNSGLAISMTESSAFAPFLHCYIQSQSTISNGAILNAIYAPNSSTDPEEAGYKRSGGMGLKNKILNGVAPSLDNTPFEADVDNNNVYTGGAITANDYRLRDDFAHCINKGTEDFGSSMYNALNRIGTSNIANNSSYLAATSVNLPDNDVAFAQRIQDCQVDIGAYEFDGTRAIEPTLFPNETPKKAVFFVTQNGSGLATAETPANAACYLKLQKVLDAAGRWRYASYKYADDEDETQMQNNINTTVLRQELLRAGVGNNINAAAISAELPNLKDYEVIVRLEGDNGSHFSYIPTRNTNQNTESMNELEKSLIVPHGIQIEGGYNDSFTNRDILGRPTYFSGELINEVLGTDGNVYHVITFTNDLFDVEERLFTRDDEGYTANITGQLTFLGTPSFFYPDDYDSLDDDGKAAAQVTAQAKVEAHRTVLDGLFIQKGAATGTNTAHQQGGAAVVTSYAHVRNCVIQNNTASKYGGGLYLEPQALVSGCIVKNNSATQGGGLYVEEPETVNSTTYVHIISTTVVDNEATQNAGGLWFNTNVRANSSAFWRNNASNYGNVAGVFATGLTQLEENYPLNYCGVGSRRVAGVNNIELPSVASEGVRWDPTMPYETVAMGGAGTGERYFPITVSSVLGRAGMTYAAYAQFRELYPTLELVDLFGLNRMAQEIEGEELILADGSHFAKVKKDNSFIEMGARVMNGNFEVKMEFSHVLTRLFVTTTERLPTDAALALQKNTVEAEWSRRHPDISTPDQNSDEYKAVKRDVETYKQMGSSFLNPFHRLGDALEYIINVRKEMTELYESGVTIGQHYKDVRFEVFVCGGTFHPFRDAHGRQGEARANTFVVPEEVTIIGGVNHETSGHQYCQETTGSAFTVAEQTLNPASTYEIRTDREHLDRNGNHVKEPWELTEQTILDGNAVQNDQTTNVYHIITCFPDVNQVGQLPTRKDESGSTLSPMFVGVNPSTGDLLKNIEDESRDSRDKRTIIIDGVTITGGYANNIDHEDESSNFQKLTYFRGGGVLVEGNWDNTFDKLSGLPEVLGVAKRNIPLMMTACTIKDNVAGNGGGVYTNGTFYAFSCHFTKNYSIGPITTTDQNYIPWTAGGAIANNYEVHLWNSLFANNEAKRGNYPITIDNITNADDRQGYGGTISCSETGLARICNCDFVRNKAVAFPALYNFIDNNLRAISSTIPDADHGTDPRYYGRGWHFAANSIFWGNEATASSVASATGWESSYYEALYGRPDFLDLRKPWHVANFGPLLDVATLTFCSYEEGTGREGTVWWGNHERAKSAPIEPKDYGSPVGELDGLTRLYAGLFSDVLDDYFGYYPDGHPETPYYKLVNEERLPSAITDENLMLNGDKVGPLTGDDANRAVPYNYNLVLESENNVPGGPYFSQPSLTAGIDGYMETSDWLVTRLNNSIDTGWGYLKQNVTMADESSGLYNTKLLKGTDVNNLTPTSPFDPHDFATIEEQYHDLYGEGFYNLHSKNIHLRFHDVGYPNLLPIGEDLYMEYSRDGEGAATNMRRISTHPKMGVQDVFIDMGIYEYQYVQLTTPGSEMDVIWVATEEDANEVCDGSTWKKATSDLQNAIETLLLSRNDHDKIIKIKGGTYSPTQMTQSNHKAFFINTPSKQDGVKLPKTLDADVTHVVKSLTIRGGYPSIGAEDVIGLDNFESKRSTELYPVTFAMTYEKGNIDQQLEHLFIIEDAEQKGTFANYMSGRNPDFKDYVMPIIFDGITFINPYGHSHDDGGAALFYKEQYQTLFDDGSQTYYSDPTRLLKAAGDGIPKLLVKDCSFITNGQCEEVSAVNIQKGGGESLFVNCLFHSNSGAPVKGVNTQLVNCTSALNGGHLTLTDVTESYHDGSSVSTYHSGVFNSIIWLDDEAQADGSKKKLWEGDDPETVAVEGISMGTSQKNVGPGDDHYMRYNAFTEWQKKTSDPDTYGWWYPIGLNMIYGTGNIRLSPNNADVLYGPNFIDPVYPLPDGLSDAEQLAMKQSRNFRLNASARTINQANTDLYKALVPYYAETYTEEERTATDGTKYFFHSVQRDDRATLTDAQLKGTDPNYTERELDYKARWYGKGIERGPYECTAAVERVLYVMEGATGQKDGTSWEHAFQLEDLQKAIDVAAIYSLTTSPREQAYVFVKAADFTNEVINPRDGVSVYGGLNTAFLEEVERESDDSYLDEKIDAYVRMVKATRSSVASKEATHSSVKGIVPNDVSTYTNGFLLDGFWVSGGTIDRSAVSMTKDNVVLRNVVIADNTVTASGVPAVNAEKGLLYNVLLYNNPTSSAPIVSVGTDGYVLNCTVVGEDGQTTLSGDGAATHVKNTLHVTEATAERAPMFAPYLRPSDRGGNIYTPANYLTEWRPYWYQLHEQSKEINAGEETDDINAWLPTALQPYVDFGHDLDVLGNPRRLDTQVDNGCFETWRIESDTHIHNTTNAAYTTNYGGHVYPHVGSVVYLNADRNLIVDKSGDGDALFIGTNPVSPGYVLLKPGASIYGQGNTLRFGYVAAEKTYSSTQYALTAFPFAYDVKDALSTNYTLATDVLTQVSEHNTSDPAHTFSSHTYDGLLRSAWDYDYHEDNSGCWVATEEMAACEGWQLNFGSSQSKTLRFTGWADNKASYAYAEEGGDKVVELTQYNSNNTGRNPDGKVDYPSFTKQENMGWNLKGQPWLVASFKTDVTATPHQYKMDVPHLFYGMNPTDGSLPKLPGQSYTYRSWDDDAAMVLGDAFFTQTAIIGDHENLTFRLPTYVAPAPAPLRPRRLVAVSKGYEPQAAVADYVEIHPHTDADPAMPYRLGTDGIKWFSFDDLHPQLYVVNDDETNLSLVSAAPEQTDIRLGLRSPQPGTLTMSLPAPAAYDDYDHVWLTDHQLGKVTDLKQQPYTLSTADAGDDTHRLTLRFGGLRPEVEDHAEQGCVISIHRNSLRISGIEPGDLIRIYTLDGIELVHTKATANSYRRTLYEGTYIVCVNELTEKVESRE